MVTETLKILHFKNIKSNKIEKNKTKMKRHIVIYILIIFCSSTLLSPLFVNGKNCKAGEGVQDRAIRATKKKRKCQTCPKGYYSPGGNDVACTKCPPNKPYTGIDGKLYVVKIIIMRYVLHVQKVNL